MRSEERFETANVWRGGATTAPRPGWSPSPKDLPAIQELSRIRGPLNRKRVREVFRRHGRRFDSKSPFDMARLMSLTGAARRSDSGPARRRRGGPAAEAEDARRRRRLKAAEREVAAERRREAAARRRRLQEAERDLGLRPRRAG